MKQSEAYPILVALRRSAVLKAHVTEALDVATELLNNHTPTEDAYLAVCAANERKREEIEAYKADLAYNAARNVESVNRYVAAESTVSARDLEIAELKRTIAIRDADQVDLLAGIERMKRNEAYYAQWLAERELTRNTVRHAHATLGDLLK